MHKKYRIYYILANALVIIFVLAILGLNVKADKLEQQDTEANQIVQTTDKSQVMAEATSINTAISAKYLGEFKVTAYCPCKKCCGKWADNRPTDKDGNEIVYTASGAVAAPGQTVAVDPNHIPYGTRLIIGGHEYIAQDTGAKVKGKVIDIMFATHEEAIAWGKQTHIVYEIEEV